MAEDPGKTPGKAEGVDETEARQPETEADPGHTPDQAEGEDLEEQDKIRQRLGKSMQHGQE